MSLEFWKYKMTAAESERKTASLRDPYANDNSETVEYIAYAAGGILGCIVCVCICICISRAAPKKDVKSFA